MAPASIRPKVPVPDKASAPSPECGTAASDPPSRFWNAGLALPRSWSSPKASAAGTMPKGSARRAAALATRRDWASRVSYSSTLRSSTE